jgi:hypothetical protein
MSADEDVKKEARIIASVGTHKKKRPESILEIAKSMEADLPNYAKAELARKYDFKGPTMVDRFLGVLKLPPDIQRRVAWGGPLGLDKAYRISKLSSDDEKRRLVEEIFKTPMSTMEVRHVLELKRKNPELTIDELVKLVRSYRPVINEIQVLVVELDEDTKRALNLTPENTKEVEGIVRSRVASILSNPGQLRGLTLQKNHVIIVLTEVGFSLFDQAAKKAGLDVLAYVNKLATTSAGDPLNG